MLKIDVITILWLLQHFMLCPVESEELGPKQSFLREPFDQVAKVGEHVTLPCRVVNKQGVLQWTRDDFGLGSDRLLEGFKRYIMTGSDEEGKSSSPSTMECNTLLLPLGTSSVPWVWFYGLAELLENYSR